jgi:hypothetical protein
VRAKIEFMGENSCEIILEGVANGKFLEVNSCEIKVVAYYL